MKSIKYGLLGVCFELTIVGLQIVSFDVDASQTVTPVSEVAQPGEAASSAVPMLSTPVLVKGTLPESDAAVDPVTEALIRAVSTAAASMPPHQRLAEAGYADSSTPLSEAKPPGDVASAMAVAGSRLEHAMEPRNAVEAAWPHKASASFLSSNKLDAVSDTIAANVATVDQTQGGERLMLFMSAVPTKGYVHTPVVSLVDFIRGKRRD